MKHVLRSAFVLFFISACGSSFGQISLLSSDLTSIGDQIVRYIDTIPTYGPGNAGANQTWDFSSAVIEDTATTNVVATASTPYASTFSGSDYAMTGATASYLYFTHTSANLITNGAAGDLLETGEIIEAPFSDALVLHVFPRTYGSYFNDTYAFQAEADGAAFNVYRIRVTHTGHVYDTTDGYGTLITPTGTYDALRVKSTDFTTDVVEVKLASFLPWTPFTTVQDTSVSYSWHAKEEMLAIAEYAYDSIGNPARFTFSTVPPVVSTAIADAENDSKLKLYPQPATNTLCNDGLAASDSYQAEVYSVNGKMILTEHLRGDCLDVERLTAGMYILRLSELNGRHQELQKFIVE